MTQPEWLTAVGLGILVSALFWIDAIFFPLALAGPIGWGAFAGARKMNWRWPVAIAVVAGLGAVISDFVINQEHVAFHLALTFTMTAFAWSAWSIALRFVREDHRG